MRILIFNELYTPFVYGGAEISTQLLAEALVGLGHEIHVCTSSDVENDEVVNGVYVHRRKQRNVYWSYCKDGKPFWKKLIWHLVEGYNIFAYKSIRQVIDMVSPDVIHTNVFTGFSVLVWKIADGRKIPIIHTLRDYYLMCVKSTLFNKGKCCEKKCMPCRISSVPKKSVSKYVNAVVGISEFILNHHLNASYFENAIIKEVIPNAIYTPPSGSQILTRSHYIGYLGRIHESKGVECLIRSFLKLENHDYILKIGGDGDSDYVNTLKKKYASEKVVFVGKVKAYDFLNSIDLLVIPSLWHEPFGRVVIEANACGCPVLVSDRGGLPELVDGQNGAVFNLEQENFLTNLLDGFIRDKLSFKVNKTKTLKMYSQDSIAHKYERVYTRLLGVK